MALAPMDTGRGKVGDARSTWVASAVFGAGMLSVATGERLLAVGNGRVAASGLGVLLVLAALAFKTLRLRKSMASGSASAASPDRTLLLFYAIGAGALVAYFLTSDLMVHLTGRVLHARWPILDGALQTAWPALWVISAFPILFTELALASMNRAPVLDGGRLRAARGSGLGVALALIFCFSLGYITSELDKKVDLSYFRVARAGESTHKLVRALDQPVAVTLFFPPANEVGEQVDSYFNDLVGDSTQLQLARFDYALAPAKAKELKVSGNGIVVIARGKVQEQIPLALQIEKARTQLKTLDQDVHKRLLGVTRPPRTAYLIQGHGERTFETGGDADRRGTVATLKSLLTDEGYEPREWSAAQGLANQVPADASVVLIVGPQKPFLPEEIQALQRYVNNKGRVLVALDPEAGLDFADLLAPWGIKFNPTLLANDRVFWQRAHLPSDRGNVVTGSFASHGSVTSLSRLGMRAPVVFPGAGSFEKNDKGSAGILNTTFTVHAEPNTWRDVNGNFEFDKGEVRSTFELVAAVTVRSARTAGAQDEGRVVALADSNALEDAVIQNLGNAYLFVDAMVWLGGEESIAGPVNNEEDVPVTHTRKQDVGWFYSTVFLAPILVLILGAVATRRRRLKRARRGQAAPPAVPGIAPEVSR